MTDDRWERIQDLFHRAKELPEEERKAFLVAECGDDPDLRAEVEKLLAHADTELESTVIQNDPPETRIPNGTRIGNYVIRGFIGEGGFGDVYLAEQTAPVRRRQVALKIIKPGMDSRQVIARFEAERQALALMDHPHVAKVFDAGATEQGRPYFVMEYIAGVPITEHCDRQKLNVKERLALFIKVCEAVQHAHQKGIIHRDLKPNNILVAPTPVETQGKEGADDAVGVPKVIDFGIAKALNQPLTEKTIFTETGQLIGTPEYMSPEQAEMTGQGIDTRSDVYSLGVLLYELLTGALPFDRGTLRGVALNEILHVIREITPKKPSTRLGSLADTPTPAHTAGRDEGTSAEYSAQRRQTNTRTLLKALRGDLDWITMRCLEKDRTRRYETATALANDIRRHLNNEPVRAGPPSRVYRTRKFVRRNRGFVIAATLVFVVLLGGIISTGVALSREAEQRRLAIQESERAKTEAAKAKQIAKFTKEMLSSVKPEIAKGMDKRLMKMILDQAAKRIDTELSDQPEVEAEIRGTIGSTYLAIGDYDTAEPHLVMSRDLNRRIRGEEDPNTLDSLGNLAQLYHKQSRFTEAEPLYQKVLEGRKHVLGEEHLNTIAAMGALANFYSSTGRYSEAESLFIKVLDVWEHELGELHSSTLNCMHNFANLNVKLGRYPEAEKLYLKSLEGRNRTLGEQHLNTLSSMEALSNLYAIMGRLNEAEPLMEKALEMYKHILGEEHPQTIACLHNLSTLYVFQKRYAEAEPLLLDVLAISKRLHGEENPNTLTSLNTLASMYGRQERYDEAEPLFVKVLDGYKRLFGEENPKTLMAMGNLASVYQNQGRYAKAKPLMLKVLKFQEQHLSEENTDRLDTMQNLAVLYANRGNQAEAEELFVKTLKVRRRVFGIQHRSTRLTMRFLATLLYKQGRIDEALPLRRELLEYDVSQARKQDANSNTLNTAAWQLLTVKPTELRDPETALGLTLKANEMTSFENWGNLDTLALANHRTGDTTKAIEMQEKALALLPPDESQSRKDMEARLEKYRLAAGGESTTTQPVTSRPDHSDNGPTESPSSQPADRPDKVGM